MNASFTRCDLALEGGGVRGIALVGAYAALDDAQIAVQRVVGTSAGAIMGAFIASGMTPARAHDELVKADWRLLGGQRPLGRFGDVYGLIVDRAVRTSSRLYEWISDLLHDEGVETWADLHYVDRGSALLPDRCYKLAVVAADIAHGRRAIFPWDYARYGLNPRTQDVAAAVVASASVPLFFPEQYIGAGVFVDGGLVQNFPIALFDRHDGRRPRWPTLGVKLSSSPTDTPHSLKDDTLPRIGEGLLNCVLHAGDEAVLERPDVRSRTICVPTDGTASSLNFNLTAEQRQSLYNRGYTATKQFIDALRTPAAQK